MRQHFFLYWNVFIPYPIKILQTINICLFSTRCMIHNSSIAQRTEKENNKFLNLLSRYMILLCHIICDRKFYFLDQQIKSGFQLTATSKASIIFPSARDHCCVVANYSRNFFILFLLTSLHTRFLSCFLQISAICILNVRGQRMASKKHGSNWSWRDHR